MLTYVEVAINLTHISGCFHYHLPPELEELISPGSLVIVPFGRQRLQGVVLRFVDTPEVPETKPVEELVDEKPVLTPIQIELARWMSEETLSPLGACINLMLPVGVSRQTDTLIKLNPDHEVEKAVLSPLEKRIINLLKKRGEIRGRQLDRALQHVEWRGTLRKLARKDVILTRAFLPPPRVRIKTTRKVGLAISPEEIENIVEPLSRFNNVHNRRIEVLRLLAEEDSLIEPSWIYAGTGGNKGDLDALEKTGLINICEVQTWRDPLEDFNFIPSHPPNLTVDQEKAWTKIRKGLHDIESGQIVKPFLLHGVTGSGKTEIYLRAVKETLAAGKRALVLVPEISLTPQTIKRFLGRFPGQVGVVHSQLSEGERYDTWRRIRNGDLRVVVGPRSALFMPIDDLGLIVMDECHHESYDQQDSQPNYQGAAVAVACARLAGAVIIMGSATPRITQYNLADRGQWKMISLPKRILAHRDVIAHHVKKLGLNISLPGGEGETADLGLPEVSIFDMRQELHQGNRSIFSLELQNSIDHVLETHQQAILFLNRRGSATYVFCRDCGYVIECPRCDKPLTFHRSMNALLCHTCGYQRNVPQTCPQCGGSQIRHLGTGTEKIQQLVEERFPGVRTLRWDSETTRKKDAHEQILSMFTSHAADILIGTQMLAKGLDLPLVTLVGVILAEVGLTLPDYRAAERTFQLLTQVAGRAGRSPLGGKVIFQTYDPENYVIQKAAGHDYLGFYSQELAQRKLLGNPPYSHLVRLEYSHYDYRKAEEASQIMADQLRTWISQTQSCIDMIGPAPCFFSKMAGRYRWHIILRGTDPREILRDRNFNDWQVEVDPSSLL
jgi:primosomal protein N' (replication factor Y)